MLICSMILRGENERFTSNYVSSYFIWNFERKSHAYEEIARIARSHCTFLKNMLSFHTVIGFLNTVTEPSRSVPPNRYTVYSLTCWCSTVAPLPMPPRPIADARPALAARGIFVDNRTSELELNAVDEFSARVLGGAGRFISRISNALSLSSSKLSGGLFSLT